MKPFFQVILLPVIFMASSSHAQENPVNLFPDAAALTYELTNPSSSGCGLGNETIRVKIRNSGSGTINSNLTASFKKGSSTVVTENVTDSIMIGDTLIFTFTTPINLSTLTDTSFIVKVWIQMLGDANPANDTVVGTIISRVALPLPLCNDVTIPFGTSIQLHATHPNTCNWFSDPQSSNLIQVCADYITPNLLDTTVYYVQAMTTLPGIKITEVIHEKTGSGATTPWPSWINGSALNTFDGLEISNLNCSPTDLSGYSMNFFSSTTTQWGVNGSWTFPAGTILPEGGICILDIKSNPSGSNPSLFYFCLGLSGGPSPNIPQAYYLKDPQGNIIDAVALNNETFPASTGVTSAHWTGLIPKSIGSAGFIRTISDNNDPSDWIPSSYSNMMTFGAMNPTLYKGLLTAVPNACPSNVKPVKVMISGMPLYNAGLIQLITPSGTYPSGSLIPVKVTLKNYSSIALTKVTVKHSVNGLVKAPYIWIGSLAYGQTTDIVVGIDTSHAGWLNYKVWTELPNDSVDQFMYNDTVSYLTFVCLSGVVTLGDTLSDFPDFASLKSVLISNGLCGTMVVRIKPGTYIGQLTLNAVNGASATSRLIFESFSGLNTDVILQYSSTSSADNWTVKLDGADYISFRNITIKNLGVAYGGVFTVSNAANHNVVEGCRLIAGAINGASYAVYDNESSNNNYNSYINNYMEGGVHTIYIHGVNVALWEKGTVIQGNEIVGSKYYPIFCKFQDSLQVIGNYIHGGVSSYSYGIHLEYTFNGYRVIGNRVEINMTTNAAGTKSNGIYDYCGNYTIHQPNPTGYGLVANNMISIHNSNGGTCRGIYSSIVNGTRYCYNSVCMTGVSSQFGSSIALLHDNDVSNTLGATFLNNIWVNLASTYAYFIHSNVQVLVSDYNAFYTIALPPYHFFNWGGSYSLAGFQTVKGKDLHSITVQPGFLSFTDLHMLDDSLNGAATPVPDVLQDFDGQPRDSLNPDIGADEIICTSANASITSGGPLDFCLGDSVQLFANQGDCYTYKWLRNGAILPNQTGQSLNVDIGGSYAVVISDINNFSDTSSLVQVSVNPLPAATVWSAGDHLCNGDSINILANTGSGLSYQWFKDGLPLSGDTNSIYLATQIGAYYVEVKDSNGCKRTSDSLQLSFFVPFEGERICAVTVDSVTGKNMVVWESTPGERISDYNIYREGAISGLYNIVGNSAFDSTCVFIDMTADPQQQSFRYKLSILDSCGNESSLSPLHASMHLSANLGSNGEVNLSWTLYEGSSFQSQRIYRSSAGGPYIQIGQVASTLNSYTDLIPPLGLDQYFIEIEMDSSCAVSTSKDTSYSMIRSNRVGLLVIGLEDLNSMNSVTLYPNPNAGTFYIGLPMPMVTKEFVIRIVDSQGRFVKEITHETGQANMEVSTMDLVDGVYYLMLENISGVKRIVIIR